jgi:hypothetical protein
MSLRAEILGLCRTRAGFVTFKNTGIAFSDVEKFIG